MLNVILTATFILQVGARHPAKFGDEGQAHTFQYRHLINMTEALCKDARIKLRYAKSLQDNFAESRTYQLGVAATLVTHRFEHMTKIYRYYSNNASYIKRSLTSRKIMNGYTVMMSEYNQLLVEVDHFYKTDEEFRRKKREQQEEAMAVAVKYNMPVKGFRNMQKKGIKLSDMGFYARRRSMKTEPKLPEHVEIGLEVRGDSVGQFLLKDPVTENINTWIPKKNVNTEEEEYKKKLRYTMWAEKWNGFDGETEGVNIADTIARIGVANDSNFLLKELKGDV